MILVNGKLSESISVRDRSFQYGDGCFTTMRTFDGRVQNWPLHIERMQACLELLAIPGPDWDTVSGWLEKAAFTDGYAGLKLHISRGEGGRGYSPAGVSQPTVTISAFLFPEHYYYWRDNGVELGVCERRLGLNPLLAGHKHNNRLEQVITKAEVDEKGLLDALVLDIQGHVVETTMANIFWKKGNTLYTPSTDMCGVAGVMRRLVIQAAPQLGLEVQIGDFTLDHLDSADEVFMTNSILGIAPVTKIQNRCFEIGAVTRSFQENQNS
ncbi:aminodeoxychorismate lyase [Vibrio sp. JC009]|uniref:aminodeoxychorismate lyase n=1 Tax=Vibrio sp. JC009 TaxID=2912314 RepID=UPI0023B023C5|nr:aminodeoxychorismate lyase [Vibrio sp. JC009]WED22677.1 aminodeoxychorismate lyase [Vibrio sp. JC009]